MSSRDHHFGFEHCQHGQQPDAAKEGLAQFGKLPPSSVLSSTEVSGGMREYKDSSWFASQARSFYAVWTGEKDAFNESDIGNTIIGRLMKR